MACCWPGVAELFYTYSYLVHEQKTPDEKTRRMHQKKKASQPILQLGGSNGSPSNNKIISCLVCVTQFGSDLLKTNKDIAHQSRLNFTDVCMLVGTNLTCLSRSIASFTQICTCVLEKFVGLFKRFSVKVKAIDQVYCADLFLSVSLLLPIVSNKNATF